MDCRCEVCPLPDYSGAQQFCNPTPENRAGLTVDELSLIIDCQRARIVAAETRADAAETRADEERQRADRAEIDRLSQLPTYPTFLRNLRQRFSHKPRMAEIIVNDEGKRCRPMLVIFADGNEFGQVNKQHGHDAGDEVIRSMARPFWNLREGDLAARRGGDEYVAAVFGLGYEEAGDVCARLSQSLAEGTRVEFANGGFVIYTASVVAVYEWKVSRYYQAEALIRIADSLLVESKRRAKTNRGAEP